MAIAFRAAGTRLKADVSVTGSPQSVSLPAGHAANDFLLMHVVTDDNTGPDTPSGWTQLFEITPGTSTWSPYKGYPRTNVFWRIDNGSLGSSVSLAFNTSPWPTGKPYVLAYVAAWTGCDVTSPIGEWGTSVDAATTDVQAHPQLSLALANCWLLTLRSINADSAKTFTVSVGTDSERVDDSHGSPAAPSFALYDSNTALGTGSQTQRSTTASAAVQYGSTMASIAIRPTAVTSGVVALPGAASITFAAKDSTAATQQGPWDLCGASGLPDYFLGVDWNLDGDFSDTGEEVTGDEIGDVVISYGRDQDRQLSPAAIGTASIRLCNVSRTYSPENPASPLFGNLDPARDSKFEVTWASTVFPLFRGRIDDFDVSAAYTDRTVSFTFLDGMALLQGFKLSTEVFSSLRTGEIIDIILDEAGWTGGRDLDVGATIVKYWWAEGTDALTAIQELIKSEGPPAVAYVGPDGTFFFHDRHHRLQNPASISSQATFAQASIDCASPAATGFSIAQPFTYAHGWRDIVNSVSFEIQDRVPATSLQDVWTSEDTIVLTTGQSVDVDISASDPFINAVVPVQGIDFIKTGAGSVTVTLSRTSGASARITVMASGGGATVTALKLRARPIPVAKTVKIIRQDTGSITAHGEKSYPEQAPWANANDAGAIADVILLHYARRRPTVQLRAVTQNPAHFVQVLQRSIGDRLRIRNDELGLNGDFFIERVTHTIQRFNQPGHPPVHSVVFGCEKEQDIIANPFTFDKRGAGFDDGTFDAVLTDTSSSVFTFDHPTQGQFDVGLFGT